MKKLLAFRRLVGEYIGIDFVFHVTYVSIVGPPDEASRISPPGRTKKAGKTFIAASDRPPETLADATARL
jgi:hypothetical protein